MTVKELMEELEKFSQEKEIYFKHMDPVLGLGFFEISEIIENDEAVVIE